MTRNDIKELFPEATKEAISALLDINSSDIANARSKQQMDKDQIDAQIKALEDQVKDLNGQVKTLNGQVAEKESSMKKLAADHENEIKKLNADHEVALKTASNEHEEAIKALNDQIKTLNADHEVALQSANDKFEADMKALNDKLKAAQDRAVVADTLTQQVANLKKDIADRDATIASRDETLASTSKQYHIKDELRNMKARDVDIIMPLLKVEDITEEDGKLNGLSEQVEALKESYGYLFETNPGQQRGGIAASPEIGNTTSANDAVNKAIRSLSGRG